LSDIKYSTLKIADNKIANADELKTRLIDEWAQFDSRSLMPLSASSVVAKVLLSVYAGHTEHKF